MGTLTVTSNELQVRFTRFEKFAGLLRDVDIPLVDVRSCTVIHHGFTATRGRRSPGFELPGRRKVGTWRSAGRSTLVCVRRHEPAVSIVVSGHRFASLLIGTPDAAKVAQDLAKWAGSGPAAGR